MPSICSRDIPLTTMCTLHGSKRKNCPKIFDIWLTSRNDNLFIALRKSVIISSFSHLSRLRRNLLYLLLSGLVFYVDLFIHCGLILENSIFSLQVRWKEKSLLLLLLRLLPLYDSQETSINLIFDNKVDTPAFDEIYIVDALIRFYFI